MDMLKARKLMNTVNILSANKQDDPLANFPQFRQFTNKNNVNIEISVCKYKQLPKEVFDWALNLVKTNVQKKCELAKIPFTDAEKSAEMSSPNAWYLLAKLQDSDRYVGFSHFRFDIDFGFTVLYVYEIHVEKDYHRTGLGKFLMNVLESFAKHSQMDKIILTALKDDESNLFYQNLNFVTDESSIDGVGYHILSKKFNRQQ